MRDARWQELSSSECHKLLARRHLGRVAMVGEEGPAVFPVSYAMDSDALLFRADAWPELPAQVALQVDELDDRGSGWSVTVRGEAMQVQEPDELSELRRTQGDGQYVRVRQTSIIGHRLGRPNDLPSNWLG